MLRRSPLLSMLFGAALTSCLTWKTDISHQHPTVVVSILVRNGPSVLPYFFGYLEELDYPKDRMAIFIGNALSSEPLLDRWYRSAIALYHSVEVVDLNQSDGGQQDVDAWRQSVLDAARLRWADYVFFIDTAVLLFNTKSLQHLMQQKRPIVAPIVTSLDGQLNCQLAATVTEDRENYEAIIAGQVRGCYAASLVSNLVLIDLRVASCRRLTFLRAAGWSSLTASARQAGLELTVCNEHSFGGLLESDEDLVDWMLDSLHSGPPGLLSSPYFWPLQPKPADRAGFDRLFLVNLQRRPDRRVRMLALFETLQLDVQLVDAVDGRQLDDLPLMGVELLPGYMDPYHKRPMKMGEVGCFLSHFRLWQQMVDERLERVIVFEDDLHFVRRFRAKLADAVRQLDDNVPDWDLVYLGRKILNPDTEGSLVPGCSHIAEVGYSYWTLAYMLSQRGAQKLLAADPLRRMVPVDEFLPIMFDQHPEEAWKSHFANRNLKAYTVVPLLVHPIRYVGQQGYISDTEDTDVIVADAAGSHPMSEEL